MEKTCLNALNGLYYLAEITQHTPVSGQALYRRDCSDRSNKLWRCGYISGQDSPFIQEL